MNIVLSFKERRSRKVLAELEALAFSEGLAFAEFNRLYDSLASEGRPPYNVVRSEILKAAWHKRNLAKSPNR
ncbi:hypothetical protein FHS85_001527 [Rhodoligotrophos appendicifer]|uniref:hypothetical protein n=1 Tax=Rhodoligotrophos appendicifer TaxID=987056 RepID=UPI001186BBB0|nr:hypothetical protein [Rhodoligotrophos appendicifer]